MQDLSKSVFGFISTSISSRFGGQQDSKLVDTEQKQVKFAKFTSIFARDLLKIINIQGSNQHGGEGESSTKLSAREQAKQRAYYQDLLLRHHPLYEEIQDQSEAASKGPQGSSEEDMTEPSSCGSVRLLTDGERIREYWLAKSSHQVTCLLVSTNVSVEIWVQNNAPSLTMNFSDVEKVDQLFRKPEADVGYFDFIHLRPPILADTDPMNQIRIGKDLNYVWQSSSENRGPSSKSAPVFLDSSDDSSTDNLFDDYAPLIGYIKMSSPSVLTVYSLKKETAVDVQRFGAPILKFCTPMLNHSNKMTVLLSDGIIKVYDLREMKTELNLSTYLISSGPALPHCELPKGLDQSSTHYAYVHSEIHHSDQLAEWQQSVEQSILGGNIYSKEVMEQAVSISHGIKKQYDNLKNIYTTTSLPNSQPSQISEGLEEAQVYLDQAYLRDGDFRPVASAAHSSNPNKQLKSELKAPLKRENKVQVVIRSAETHQVLGTIEPTPELFKSISILKFSPSGRYLVIGNENCQCFQVYEVLPSTGIRTNGPSGPHQTNMAIGIYPRDRRSALKLQYYLFRGYTSAKVTDIQFVSRSNCSADLEQILVINTSNGTTHIYNLNKANQLNQSPIIKNEQSYKAQSGTPDSRATALLNQLQMLEVSKIEQNMRIKYSSLQEGLVFEGTNEGVYNYANKMGEEIGIVSKQPQLLQLISNVRQEYSPETNTFIYQIHSYTSRNQYYVVDLGTHLDSAGVQQLSQLNQQQNFSLKGRLASMFCLSIPLQEQGAFVPICHQTQVLDTVRNCGEFTFEKQSIKKGRKARTAKFKGGKESLLAPHLLSEVEERSYYPKVMLELRLNRNICMKTTKPNFKQADSEWTASIDEQLVQMTEDSYIEKCRYQQPPLTQSQMLQQDDLGASTLSQSKMSLSTVLKDNYFSGSGASSEKKAEAIVADLQLSQVLSDNESDEERDAYRKEAEKKKEAEARELARRQVIAKQQALEAQARAQQARAAGEVRRPEASNEQAVKAEQQRAAEMALKKQKIEKEKAEALMMAQKQLLQQQQLAKQKEQVKPPPGSGNPTGAMPNLVLRENPALKMKGAPPISQQEKKTQMQAAPPKPQSKPSVQSNPALAKPPGTHLEETKNSGRIGANPNTLGQVPPKPSPPAKQPAPQQQMKQTFGSSPGAPSATMKPSPQSTPSQKPPSEAKPSKAPSQWIPSGSLPEKPQAAKPAAADLKSQEESKMTEEQLKQMKIMRMMAGFYGQKK